MRPPILTAKRHPRSSTILAMLVVVIMIASGSIALASAAPVLSDHSRLSAALGHSSVSSNEATGVSSSSTIRSDSIASAQLNSAASSLAHGMGPADGKEVTCQISTVGSSTCGVGAPSNRAVPAPPPSSPTPTSPAGRADAAMAYDGATGYVLLYGGYSVSGSTTTTYSDTWSFEGGVWTQLSPSCTSTCPPAMHGASMAYDGNPSDKYIVMFGGVSGTTYYSNTFKFSIVSGTPTWTLLSCSSSCPSARFGAQMTYDGADNYVLLFGGCPSTGCPLSDTWEFSGGTWTSLTSTITCSPSTSCPAARYYGGMVFDQADDYVLMVNGCSTGNPCTAEISDTYYYTGGLHPTWTQVSCSFPAVCPTAEYGAAVFFDTWTTVNYYPYTQYVALVGGCGSTCPESMSTTWDYEAGSWHSNTPGSAITAIPSRFLIATAWDASDGYALLTGGTSGTAYYGDSYTYVAETYAPMNTVPPTDRFWASMAYDNAQGFVVLYGGHTGSTVLGDTWAYRDGLWSPLTVSCSPCPAALHDAGMTYDVADGYLMMFGGYNSGTYYGDVWEFSEPSGVPTWTKLSVTCSPACPSARYGEGLVYDAASTDKYVLMFGGCASAGCPLSDTWEYLAGKWTSLSPTCSPSADCPLPARYRMGMVYDSESGANYVLMFGGCSGAYSCSTQRSDTWEYVNDAWTYQSCSGSCPSARFSPAIGFNPADQFVTMFGGCGLTCPLSDTWQWNQPGGWSSVTPLSATPSARYGASVTYDQRTYVLDLFGGCTTGTTSSCTVSSTQTWEILTTTSFSAPNYLSVPTTTSPVARWGAGMTYDALDEYVVQFGGCGLTCPWGDTSSYVGGSWTQVSTQYPPQGRQFGVMAYDAADSYVVFYGGYSRGEQFTDTWTYSGGTWTNLPSACTTSCPSNSGTGAPYGMVMVYDAKSTDKYIMLFGTDRTTWKFSAGTWSQFSITCSSTTCPSQRWYAQATYDSGDGYVVLYGGCTTSGCTAFDSDTWSFSGGAWSQITVSCYHSICPSGRGGAAMAYDTADGYVLMFGGCGSTCPLGDTWKYSGSLWTQVPITGASPLPRFLAGAAYDAQDSYVVLSAGDTGSAWGSGGALGGDTWSYSGGSWTLQ